MKGGRERGNCSEKTNKCERTVRGAFRPCRLITLELADVHSALRVMYVVAGIRKVEHQAFVRLQRPFLSGRFVALFARAA